MSTVLDNFILSQAEPHYLKVARIIGTGYIDAALKSAYETEQNQSCSADALCDALGERIIELVEKKQLQAQGNLRKWRFSEVRLPE